MKPEEELPQEKAQASPKGRKKPLWRIAFLLLFLLLAMAALFWSRTSPVERLARQDAALPVVAQVTVQKNAVMAFDPFLIPLSEKSRYAFISLSFSLELPNGQSGKEIRERMSELRGFIYDSLKEDFQKAEGIPLIQAVKDGIERAIRLRLRGQQVKEVYISQFLAL
jgi:flagellar basal body-associated protein FliL